LHYQAVTEHERKLTPEEARAVMDLHHLRMRMQEEDGGYVEFDELREVLAVEPDELQNLVLEIRGILPPRLALSENRVTQKEAELIVARKAREETPIPLPIIDFQSDDLLEVARSRSAELGRLEARVHAPGHIEEFGVKVGENPNSWLIMWVWMIGICFVLAILILFFRG
jgi:hypothetical protein